MSPFGLAVVPSENASCMLARASLAPLAFLRSLSNSRQHSHTRLEIRFWDTSKQFVSKFLGCGVDLRNHTLGAPAEQHHFASAIMWRTCPRNPSFTLQPMQ
jgi:hypothetical protein